MKTTNQQNLKSKLVKLLETKKIIPDDLNNFFTKKDCSPQIISKFKKIFSKEELTNLKRARQVRLNEIEKIEKSPEYQKEFKLFNEIYENYQKYGANIFIKD